jgi:hypothetical protein
MDLVLYSILKLLSRPVVCTNFQGLETNTFSARALGQGHSIGTKFKFHAFSMTYCTGQPIPHEPKFWSAPPLFLEDEDIFQKIGLHGCNSTAIPLSADARPPPDRRPSLPRGPRPQHPPPHRLCRHRRPQRRRRWRSAGRGSAAVFLFIGQRRYQKRCTLK